MKTEVITESTYIEPEDKMKQFDGFYSRVKKELDYQKQCEMTPVWY